MNIEETIRRQAEAVKANSNNAKAADLLIQAANLLKGNQPAHAGFSRTENVGKKYDRIHRFGAARAKIADQDTKKKLLDDAHNDLTADGWKPIARNPQSGTGVYNHAMYPGFELKTEGEHFSLSSGTAQIIHKTHLKELKPTLKNLKDYPKKNK